MIIDLEVLSDASPLDMEVSSDSGETDLSGLEAPTVINTDYNALSNKPRINGVELIGDKSSAELHIDRTYIHEQNSAAAEWTITHNLGKFPSVTIVDSAGTKVVGSIRYIDEDTVECSFNGVFSGKAYLN